MIEDFSGSRDLSAGERAALVENWGAILDNLRQAGVEITPDNIVQYWKEISRMNEKGAE